MQLAFVLCRTVLKLYDGGKRIGAIVIASVSRLSREEGGFFMNIQSKGGGGRLVLDSSDHNHVLMTEQTIHQPPLAV
ncbi:hypothetical protein HUG15_16595 [Salicibibacter cibarius]|uniref:Uncharacterized protein n=1 Tax=Salicibibacter cibarius TaxID=2743000 RepID=A0A7T6Z582_9BACI|nr:hypothetical protein HUG15_16595 [Salicibibacter cibarius]